MKYATAGFEFVVTFALGAAAGVYLDRLRGGETIWPVVGAAAGFAAAMCNIVRLARQYRRDADEKDKQR